MSWTRKWSLSRRTHVTKYAHPVRDANIPLHSADVKTVDLVTVKERMAFSARLRFEQLLRHLESAPFEPGSPPPSSLSVADAVKLVEDGNAVKLPDASGTRGWCNAPAPVCGSAILTEMCTSPLACPWATAVLST
jgi:hypothetical protein